MKKKTELGAAGTNRRSFLRQVGKSLAIGLGVALIPTSQALAATTCCRDNSCSGCQWPSESLHWWPTESLHL